MHSSRAFRPDWTSAPGDTIADLLRERRISVVDFAQRIGRSHEDALGLLRGQTTITIDLARQLASLFDSSVEFWMSRDFQYQEESERLEEEWLAALPVDDMVRFGWIKSASDKLEQKAAVLGFFNAPSVGALRGAYLEVQELVAFRTSPAFKSLPAAVAAWLRQGEIQAGELDCGSWNAKAFEESLSGVRALTREKDPKRFLPRLVTLCAQCGVAVAIVRAPSGCRASGATKFLSSDKALLLLSFRYLTDDQFWFTFFHEAGHLLLHGGRGLILEGAGEPQTAEEHEANDFAAGILIPPDARPALPDLPLDAREVIRFAVRLGISPGVVVGQLQHAKKIPHHQLNRLKRHFKWES